MKFIANENLPLPSIHILQQAGYAVESIRESVPGTSDLKIIQLAQQSGSIILTFDKDFGEIIFRHPVISPPAIIFFRFKGNDPEFAGHILTEIISHNLCSFDNFFTVIEQSGIRQRKYNNPRNMKINTYPDYKTMSAATAEFIIGHVQRKPQSLLCFPSGDTPTETLRLLVEATKKKEVDFSQCSFIGLDEWIGMDGTMEGSCEHYVRKHFFSPAGIPEKNITFFNARATDIEGECKRIDNVIFRHGGIDLIMVGVGMNGHIGLNEPGVSPALYSHRMQLEATTRQTAQKYFTEHKTLTEGITLGLRHVMEAKTAVIIANGKKKAEIMQKITEGPVTTDVPGSILQRHANSQFFLDQEAASLLKIS